MLFQDQKQLQLYLIEHLLKSDENFEITENELKIVDGERRNIIEKIEEIHYEDDVYDIETSNGKFNAGVGNIVVANTDSIFLKFIVDPEKKNVKDIFDLSKICSELITNNLFKKPPIKLEFEKIYYPLFYFAKKKYTGKKFLSFEDLENCKASMDSKGNIEKRRNYCNFSKKIFQELLNVIFDTTGYKNENKLSDKEIYKKFVEIITDNIRNLYQGKINKTDLVLTCKLADISSYKTDAPVGITLYNKQLAREPNNPLQIGDRIVYLYTKSDKKSAKTSDVVETFDYVIQNNISINYDYYIRHQIQTPITELLLLRLPDKEKQIERLFNILTNEYFNVDKIMEMIEMDFDGVKVINHKFKKSCNYLTCGEKIVQCPLKKSLGDLCIEHEKKLKDYGCVVCLESGIKSRVISENILYCMDCYKELFSKKNIIDIINE